MSIAPRRPPAYPIGQRFGRLTYEAFTRRNHASKPYGRFRCDCGETKELRIDAVRASATNSCGCLPTGCAPGANPPAISPGDRFGRLTFTRFANDRARYRGIFRCDCGADPVINIDVVARGETNSCGCLRRETTSAIKRRHGESGAAQNTPEYRTWKGMRRRCRDPKSNRWAIYGGRGIAVCERWNASFETFLADMGRKPSPAHSIDRFPDNDGNYEPGNCRWATPQQQRENQRRTRHDEGARA